MGALADSLLEIFGEPFTLAVLVLTFVDVIQIKYLERRIKPINNRMMRLEDQFIAADGGTEDDDREP